MMYFKRVTVWLIVLVVLISPVHADLRVLFRFDDAGVQVYRVLQTDDTSEFARLSKSRSLSGMSEGQIIMKWLDSDGELLGSSEAADPRVSHSPNHTNSFVQSRHALKAGGWLANGPDQAESVVVELPERLAMGLAAETWVLSLSGNQ